MRFDYYPFGMMMPGRKYAAESGYRYGFNGKENDNEVKGEGNQQDYGMRIYDPRLGKFLSVDPLTQEYPWNSVYAFAENSPMLFKDLDGEERIHYQRTTVNGRGLLTYMKKEDFKEWKWNPHKGGARLGFYLWTRVKNPRVEYVVHQDRDGTIEKFDKVQFVTYDETWTYSSFDDMIHRKDGDYGGEKTRFYAMKGLQNISEANKEMGGGGGGLNWANAITRGTRKKLIKELAENKIKHTADNIVDIAKNQSGKIVFLEMGDSKAGLTHILEKHGDDFVKAGIKQDDITKVVMDAATNGKQVGMQGTRPIYEVMYNGAKKNVAVSVSNNGFIVGANPASVP